MNEDKFELELMRILTFKDFQATWPGEISSRRSLIERVLRVLDVSDCWIVDFEKATEWEGRFPVHLRLTHCQYSAIRIDVISPSNILPLWEAYLLAGPDTEAMLIWTGASPESVCFQLKIDKVEEYFNAGFDTVQRLFRALKMGGA